MLIIYKKRLYIYNNHFFIYYNYRITNCVTYCIVFCTIDILLNIVYILYRIYCAITYNTNFDYIGFSYNEEVGNTIHYKIKYIVGNFLEFSKFIFSLIIVLMLIMYIIWTIINIYIPEYLLPLPIPIRNILKDTPPLPDINKSGIFALFDSIICSLVSPYVHKDDTLEDKIRYFFNFIGFPAESIAKFLNTSTKYVFKTVFPQIDLNKFENKIKTINFYQKYLNESNEQPLSSSYFCQNRINSDNDDNDDKNDNNINDN